jgi:hypothetical protein
MIGNTHGVGELADEWITERAPIPRDEQEIVDAEQADELVVLVLGQTAVRQPLNEP